MINETGGGLWIRELNEDSQDSFHELSNFKPEQAEIERLVCEVAKLKMERDIQKKTANCMLLAAFKLAFGGLGSIERWL